MKLLFKIVCVIVAAIHFSAVGAVQCPDLSIVHPRTGIPLQCQIYHDCMSATCYTHNAITALTPQAPAANSLTFQLDPCSKPIQLTLNGSLPSSSAGLSVFRDVLVTGSVRVKVNQKENVTGYLRVHSWGLTANILQFGIEACSLDPDDPCLLFNTTLSFNKAELCTINTDNSSTDPAKSDSQQQLPPVIMQVPTRTTPTPSVTTNSVPTQTMCEVLQAVGRANELCDVANSCQVMECNILNDYYRIIVTFLPCEKTPGVNVEVYHLLEKLTLLDDMYTVSQHEVVRLGEGILFDLDINIGHSSNMDYITFMLEVTFPWEENLIVFPATLIPISLSHCQQTQTTATTLLQGTMANRSQQPEAFDPTTILIIAAVTVVSIALLTVIVSTITMAGCVYCRRNNNSFMKKRSYFQHTNFYSTV